MKISSISLILFAIFACPLASHGDTDNACENTGNVLNLLVKRPLPDAETVGPKRTRRCEPEPEISEVCKPTEEPRLLGKKRLMPEATNKKGKHHKTYDPLADLGFDLDEVLSQLAQPPELDGMSLILDDSHERPSVLTKRDRPKEIATRPKAKKRKTPENHFDLTVDNLFYLNQETNVFELDEAVLAEIKNTLSTTPITSINFNQETNNATVIWWLVFAGYSSNKELVGIMDVVLAALHGKINLEYAPSGRLNYLSINLMMQYARTSFWPKHADTQFTLRTLLKTHKKPQRILEDMGYQENLLNTDFFDSFNSMNI